MGSVKRWLNKKIRSRYPGMYYGFCGHRWCVRMYVYDYRCPWHQGDK